MPPLSSASLLLYLPRCLSLFDSFWLFSPESLLFYRALASLPTLSRFMISLALREDRSPLIMVMVMIQITGVLSLVPLQGLFQQSAHELFVCSRAHCDSSVRKFAYIHTPTRALS